MPFLLRFALMESQLKEVLAKIKIAIEGCQDTTNLNQIYLDVFGKSGSFTNLAKLIATVEKEKRPQFGQQLNAAKTQIEGLFTQRKKKLQKSRPTTFVDITAPGTKTSIGHLHLVSQAIEEIVDIFKKIGFSLQSYPEVDWDWYAFESLNMPKDHPARDDWETFFVKSSPPAGGNPKYGRQVLTPHTSNGQVREMERVKTPASHASQGDAGGPPIRMLNIARCYRRQVDVSHTPMFHQCEGMLVDKNISISNLKGTLDYFSTQFFGPSRLTRLRPHHFRFTEPSFEVDITCAVCLGRGCRFCKSGWVELGGAGMVHPNVLKSGRIDPKVYSGFAFGLGVERIIAMRTDLGDIRLLYQNDIRFLEQF